MKYFCPWCGLELVNNHLGSGHVDDNAAWCISECEYTVGSISYFPDARNKPVSELERYEATIKSLALQRKQLNKLIRQKYREQRELMVREGLLIE